MKAILGTGQLGMAVMEMLLKENPNEEILLVNRKGAVSAKLSGNVRVASADVTDKHAVEEIAKKADVLFSCTDVPYQHWSEFYPRAASALAYGLINTKTKLVFADNMYSYGSVAGEVMHEELPHKAKTKKGLIRASVINILLGSGNEFSNRVAFVKAADFIGPRIHKGLFGKDFLDSIYTGKTVIMPGKTYLPHTFTYIYDFAQAMVNIGEAQDTYGQIWHAPNAPAIPLKSWIELFESASEKKIKVFTAPKLLVRIAGLFDKLTHELYELSYQFEYAYLVSHGKYERRFGNHATSPETIVAQTVQWYKDLRVKI